MHTRRHSGFTLLEVLIATFIATIFLSVLFQIVSQSLLFLRKSEDRFYEDIKAVSFILEVLSSGEKEGSKHNIDWRIEDREIDEEWNENGTFKLRTIELRGNLKRKYKILIKD